MDEEVKITWESTDEMNARKKKEEEEKKQETPALSKLLADAKTEAVPCRNPEKPEYKISKEWKYGCFCGKDHPNLSPDFNVAFTPEQREHLMASYYRIKPYDDIDTACQEHDVCWIRFGKSEIECNDELDASLMDIRAQLRSRIGFFDTETTEFRCAHMALDMAFSTLYFPGDSDDNVKSTSTKAARAVVSPIGFAYAIPYYLMSVFPDNYPRAGERCIRRY